MGIVELCAIKVSFFIIFFIAFFCFYIQSHEKSQDFKEGMMYKQTSDMYFCRHVLKTMQLKCFHLSMTTMSILKVNMFNCPQSVLCYGNVVPT